MTSRASEAAGQQGAGHPQKKSAGPTEPPKSSVFIDLTEDEDDQLHPGEKTSPKLENKPLARLAEPTPDDDLVRAAATGLRVRKKGATKRQPPSDKSTPKKALVKSSSESNSSSAVSSKTDAELTRDESRTEATTTSDSSPLGDPLTSTSSNGALITKFFNDNEDVVFNYVRVHYGKFSRINEDLLIKHVKLQYGVELTPIERPRPRERVEAAEREADVERKRAEDGDGTYPYPKDVLERSRKEAGGTGQSWLEYEEDAAIFHMLNVRDEGDILGEERFREVSRRLAEDDNIVRSWFGVKNFWNRSGRARSGFDERKKKTPELATSKQGKAARARNANKKVGKTALNGKTHSGQKQTVSSAPKKKEYGSRKRSFSKAELDENYDDDDEDTASEAWSAASEDDDDDEDSAPKRRKSKKQKKSMYYDDDASEPEFVKSEKDTDDEDQAPKRHRSKKPKPSIYYDDDASEPEYVKWVGGDDDEDNEDEDEEVETPTRPGHDNTTTEHNHQPSPREYNTIHEQTPHNEPSASNTQTPAYQLPPYDQQLDLDQLLAFDDPTNAPLVDWETAGLGDNNEFGLDIGPSASGAAAFPNLGTNGNIANPFAPGPFDDFLAGMPPVDRPWNINNNNDLYF